MWFWKFYSIAYRNNFFLNFPKCYIPTPQLLFHYSSTCLYFCTGNTGDEIGCVQSCNLALLFIQLTFPCFLASEDVCAAGIWIKWLVKKFTLYFQHPKSIQNRQPQRDARGENICRAFTVNDNSKDNAEKAPTLIICIHFNSSHLIDSRFFAHNRLTLWQIKREDQDD